MRVAITGASGLIGRRLTNEIIKRAALVGASGEARAVEELILIDRHPFEPPAGAPFTVTRMVADLCDDETLADLGRRAIDSLFHLAATLTIEAERDFDRGWAVNLHLPFRLLEMCRASGRRTRFVYASSIAVFGGSLPNQLPEQVGDAHVQRPQTSYGTAKAVTELLLNDYTRHGYVDARALRLPIVVIRPRAATATVSDVISSLMREPLAGRNVVSPLGLAASFPIVSVKRAAENLLRLHDAPESSFGDSRAVNQPGLTVNLGDILSSLARIAGVAAADRVSITPDHAVARVVQGWPERFVTEAHALGLEPDAGLDEILRAYLASGAG